MRLKVYVAYRYNQETDDYEPVGTGTKRELEAMTGVKAKTIEYYATPHAHNRYKNMKFIVQTTDEWVTV